MQSTARGGRAGLALAVALLAGATAQAQPPAAMSSECGSENLLAGATPAKLDGVAGEARILTDSTIAAEGAPWDAPAAVTLTTPSAMITYDLGAPRSISALYLQADANDSYEIQGSTDGGLFTTLIEAPNVRDRGHGLRGRPLTLTAPATVRYLRVGRPRGDNAYSITELAAYCTAPRPFPPALALDPASRAASNNSARDQRAARTAISNARRDALLRVGALLAAIGLLGLALPWLARWRARDRAAASAARPGRLGSTHGLLHLVFAASGCAALIYEIVWFHLLRLVIGASSLSVGIVLASFMGGMFLGSLLFARLVPPARDPFKVYALLEIGIGVFGLLMPLLLPALRSLYIGLFGYGALGIALRAAISAIVLLPPTALMGATLPAIARRYTGGRRGMSGLASLYAANTIGAVAGCLLCGFVLLALFDVWVATFSAAALNLVAGGAALLLGRRAAQAGGAAPAPAPAAARAAGERGLWLVYAVAALSGLTALGAQVVWTRLLTLLFGATVYAFSIILAVFLAGLGIGGALASYLVRRGLPPLRGLAFTQLGLLPTLLGAGVLLARVLPYSSPTTSIPVQTLHALHVLRAIEVILPAALLWGMSFPLALAAAGNAAQDTGRSSGHVYAANTAGAIAGALFVSFVAIPTWGTQWSQQALAIIAGISAALLLGGQPALASAGPKPRAKLATPLLALGGGVLTAAVLPGLSAVFLAHGRAIWSVDPNDRYPFVAEGAASTVAVHVAPDGYRHFHVSGRVEASNNPADLRLERLLGHLSALAHPKPESVLVVGLGGGVTAGALAMHPEVKRLVICEIEPRVTGAAEQFAVENGSVLTQPKVEVVFDDARHFLATTHERFDVITSDPIHPWVRGNSVLFSREYYEIVRSRLKPGGIATQWVPLYDTNEQAIQIQMKTFIDAFPDGTVWNSSITHGGYDVVLLGRVEPIRIDVGVVQARIDRSPAIAASLRQVKIVDAIDLLSTYGADGHDMRDFIAGAAVNRDFSLKLEYISGLAINQHHADAIYGHMVAQRSTPAALFEAHPRVKGELIRRIMGK